MFGRCIRFSPLPQRRIPTPGFHGVYTPPLYQSTSYLDLIVEGTLWESPKFDSGGTPPMKMVHMQATDLRFDFIHTNF